MEYTLKYLIVEDDDIDRLSVETEADKFPFLKRIASCGHALEAMELITECRPDILFLDIEMPGINGIQFVKMLSGTSIIPVFITSHPEFAIESFEIEAFDYLLKPLTADRFARCARRLHDFCRLRLQAFAFAKEQETGSIIIKQGHEKCKLMIHDILFLEAMKDYTRIMTADKQYLVLTTLSDMQERLPADKFVRIHRSYIVHTDKITAVKSNKVFVTSNELPVGKLYKNALKGLLTLFFIVFIGLSKTFAQTVPAPKAPDLAKLPAYKDTMTSWVAWCESLRLNAATNFLQLRTAGLKGLEMSRPDDVTSKAQFFVYTALGYYYQSRFDSAEYYFFQSLYAGLKAHNARLIDRACVALIPVTFQMQQMDKVDSIKNIMQSIVDTTHDRDLLKDGYYALGSYYQYKSYYSSAQDYFIKSIELREQEVDTTQEPKRKFDFAIQCDMLSKLYLNAGMVDKSLASLRNGERFADVSPNVGNRLSSSFVEAFTTSGHIDSALYYDKKLEAAVTNPMLFPSEIVSSDLNIAIYYLDHHQYDRVLPYLVKADSLATKIQSPVLNFQVQMTRGRYLEGTGKFPQAIAQLKLSIPVAQQLDKELYGNDLKYMALAQEGAGNTTAALQYYKEYVEVTDSLNKEKISRTFADLETHYQTHEKELQITSLDKENRLHLLELENASRTKLLLVLGLAALGVISLLLYFIYRNKEKLNRVLGERNDQLDTLNRDLAEANETKARLFGIIGHDLRGPVGKIVRLLQLQKERPELFSREEREKHEERLKKASENVLETMEDLLLWSKSQMQHFLPDFHSVRVAEVLQKEINLVQEQLEDNAVAVESRVPEALILVTDENFLAVILRNLLQNAVRHSDGSKIIMIAGGAQELSITNPSSTADIAAMNKRLTHTWIDSGASGLGLQIANDLAARIHARIFFRGEDGVALTAVVTWNGAAAAV
jgi:DNA-binding LytR/AlgR family response regulator/signal transduction histidine kinase